MDIRTRADYDHGPNEVFAVLTDPDFVAATVNQMSVGGQSHQVTTRGAVGGTKSLVSLIDLVLVQRMSGSARPRPCRWCRGPAPAEGLLPDDRTGRLVVDVEVAGGEPQRASGLAMTLRGPGR
jgi:hypothetical protein